MGQKTVTRVYARSKGFYGWGKIDIFRTLKKKRFSSKEYLLKKIYKFFFSLNTLYRYNAYIIM